MLLGINYVHRLMHIPLSSLLYRLKPRGNLALAEVRQASLANPKVNNLRELSSLASFAQFWYQNKCSIMAIVERLSLPSDTLN